jgi:hypothetical protein
MRVRLNETFRERRSDGLANAYYEIGWRRALDKASAAVYEMMDFHTNLAIKLCIND